MESEPSSFELQASSKRLLESLRLLRGGIEEALRQADSGRVDPFAPRSSAVVVDLFAQQLRAAAATLAAAQGSSVDGFALAPAGDEWLPPADGDAGKAAQFNQRVHRLLYEIGVLDPEERPEVADARAVLRAARPELFAAGGAAATAGRNAMVADLAETFTEEAEALDDATVEWAAQARHRGAGAPVAFERPAVWAKGLPQGKPAEGALLWHRLYR